MHRAYANKQLKSQKSLDRRYRVALNHRVQTKFGSVCTPPGFGNTALSHLWWDTSGNRHGERLWGAHWNTMIGPCHTFLGWGGPFTRCAGWFSVLCWAPRRCVHARAVPPVTRILPPTRVGRHTKLAEGPQEVDVFARTTQCPANPKNDTIQV